MTEKWASFHEENPEAVEPKVAKAKMKPKASVKKKVGKEKKEKSSVVGKKSRTSEDGKVEDLNAVGKKSEEKSKKEAKKSAGCMAGCKYLLKKETLRRKLQLLLIYLF